ncbi:MAG: response regulator [Melioribacteraceae bacterium]|nr:response regulator [Melioribacteraceae bacterium]
MKILAVDDQQLILTSIRHKLKNAGYELYFAKEGKEALEIFDRENPDLMILDLNMPEYDGFYVLDQIRAKRQNEVPIIVMSGEDEEDIIVKAFNEGADDYVQKPVGLNELLVRINKLLKNPLLIPVKADGPAASQKIQKNIVGVVIPCYNEEKRLKTQSFTNFVEKKLGYHLCFVNDGSKDNTLEVLNKLSEGREEYISVYNCPINGGKAEAVRLGILHLVKDPQIDYFGYLDADLSTNFEDFEDLVQTIATSDFQIVGGSRMARMGANITKEGGRAIISKSINLIIRNILGMSFNDTQCGAKVMTREVAENMFNTKFLTSWLFDVEIFLRMKKYYGVDSVNKLICEQPLKRWIHEEGSHLSMKDSFKILYQLLQIKLRY